MTHEKAALQNYLKQMMQRTHDLPQSPLTGKVTEVIANNIKAWLPGASIGDLCTIEDITNTQSMQAEVVGISSNMAILTPVEAMIRISTGSPVFSLNRQLSVQVGEGLPGAILDGLGRPFVGADYLSGPTLKYKLDADAPNPLTRNNVAKPFATGIKAIDGLLTCGEGQRIGIFAGAGCGKSTLLQMLMHGSNADVIVLGLVGERGREVREFVEQHLSPDDRARSVIVIATSDRSALERSKAAMTATSIAEYFRDQGKRVLLLLDSLTRFARALREIGLSAGEPPTRRGFPPSVFSQLPRLLERAGNNDKGSITAFYTILVEGDDMSEPIADEVKSILDGHIILSAKLAAENRYPAIDILSSRSRVMNNVVTPLHSALASKFRSLLSAYQNVEFLLRVGEYKPGADALTDEAINRIESLREYLSQKSDEPNSFEDSLSQLRRRL